MAKCSFCGNLLPRGTGTMFVKKEGTIFFFCSSKCEKNLLDLKRSPQAKKWTLAGKSLAEGFAKQKASKEGKKK